MNGVGGGARAGQAMVGQWPTERTPAVSAWGGDAGSRAPSGQRSYCRHGKGGLDRQPGASAKAWGSPGGSAGAILKTQERTALPDGLPCLDGATHRPPPCPTHLPRPTLWAAAGPAPLQAARTSSPACPGRQRGPPTRLLAAGAPAATPPPGQLGRPRAPPRAAPAGASWPPPPLACPPPTSARRGAGSCATAGCPCRHPAPQPG